MKTILSETAFALIAFTFFTSSANAQQASDNIYDAGTPVPVVQEAGQSNKEESLTGYWSLKLDSGLPAWMRVTEAGADSALAEVNLRLYVGRSGPYAATRENGRLRFEMKRKGRGKNAEATVRQVDVGLTDGVLDGTITTTVGGGTAVVERFTGVKVPPMPKQAPDLTKVKFAEPITLFNGNDLTGWRPHEPDKKMGWSVKDGLLVNTTPKTDFSATGAYANLRTEAEFEDFHLHIEFRIGKARNSGIYLRGMYEAQVVDRDSRMQGLQGVGAIFNAIPPSKNAGKVGGQWQTYDLTLVDRHVTVVLNGEKVIDNQPVPNPTAGAIYTNPAAPGPIYLQGDHTSVDYRNIRLAPVIKDSQ